MSFSITGIDPHTAQTLRSDAFDGTIDAREVVLEEPGAPCRQCLQPAQAGERVLLLRYQAFRGDGPYCVPTPIYLHASPCRTYDATDQVPPVVRPGLRAVRAYDERHDLLDGIVIDGADVEVAIDKLFGDERTAYLHVSSATAGCFTCRVDRAPATDLLRRGASTARSSSS